MKRIHIVGRKNSGKTTLVAELVSELSSRGKSVGTIKHTHHQHELDTPGKDSHTHREAGASVVGILSRKMSAAFWPTESTPIDSPDARYEIFKQTFDACDVVIVEGDTNTTAPKIEVWRAINRMAPLAESISGVCAIVTDDPCDQGCSLLVRSNVSAIADFVLSTLS